MGLPVTQGAFNLLEEKWIPVLYGNGKSDRVGIRQALTAAHKIRQIAASNPMDRVALLRFLLAVLMWCKEDAKSSLEALGENTAIPEDWLAKLERHKAAFNLLGDGPRFYQDSTAAESAIGASNLIHEFPSGSKIAHFRHIHDDRDGLCLGCCALALVRWSVLASAGTAGRGQSMTASLNGNTPAFAFRVGPSLLNTLEHEMRRLKSVKGDSPIWDGASKATPLGHLKGFTWCSRSIWLAPPSKNEQSNLREGQCSYCGQQSIPVVYKIHFRPGWSRHSNKPWEEDPHLLWLDVKEKEKIVPSWPSPNEALEHHAEIWESLIRGLFKHLPLGQGVKFETVLVASAQALYKHIASCSLTIPATDKEKKNDFISELDWTRQVIWATVNARTGQGKTKANLWGKPPKGHAIVAHLRESRSLGHAIRSSLCALSGEIHREIEKSFRELLWEQDVKKWRHSVKNLLDRNIEQAVQSTTPGSPLRRRDAKSRVQALLNKKIEELVEMKQQSLINSQATVPVNHNAAASKEP